MLHSFKGAVFDLDGTVLDSLGIWHEIDVSFLKRRGIAVPHDYAQEVTHMTFRQAAEYTVARFSLPESPDTLEREWFAMVKDAYAHEIGLTPYAKEFLTYLKEYGFRLAVATSGKPVLFESALKRNGIDSLFSAFVTVDEVGKNKSFPDVYLKAAERLSLRPAECLVFEDSLVAAKSAKSGGFYTVALSDREAPEWADCCAPDLKTCLKILQSNHIL